MIGFLKTNHFGRATFLPLTSVRANRNTKNEAALGEKGVLGIANKLVKCDPKFDEVVAYLLGRVIVVDTIDNAIALAKKKSLFTPYCDCRGRVSGTGRLYVRWCV